MIWYVCIATFFVSPSFLSSYVQRPPSLRITVLLQVDLDWAVAQDYAIWLIGSHFTMFRTQPLTLLSCFFCLSLLYVLVLPYLPHFLSLSNNLVNACLTMCNFGPRPYLPKLARFYQLRPFLSHLCSSVGHILFLSFLIVLHSSPSYDVFPQLRLFNLAAISAITWIMVPHCSATLLILAT